MSKYARKKAKFLTVSTEKIIWVVRTRIIVSFHLDRNLIYYKCFLCVCGNAKIPILVFFFSFFFTSLFLDGLTSFFYHLLMIRYHTVPQTVGNHQHTFLIGYYFVADIWYFIKKRNENNKNANFILKSNKKYQKVHKSIK